MAAQQYNLRWNNHTSNMVQVLGDLFDKEHMVDVTISCQAQFLKAHKIVLGSCSQYFQEIFDRHQTTPHPVIIMNGARFDDVRAIIEFMYRGEIKVCEGELESLLETAESLQVKGLSNIRASRLNQAHSGESATLNPTHNFGGVNGGSHKKNHTSDLGANRGGSESPEKNVNSHKNSIVNNNSHIETHGNGTGNNGLDQNESGGTPMHLRRKRKRNAASNAKDINENSNNGINYGGSTSNNTTPADEDPCDDLPMTIKIDPPYIRDIDEDENIWESQKETTNDSNDGVQESKVKAKRSMGKSASTAVSEPKEKIPRPPNAFMIFANEWRRKLATQHPNESNKEISVRLGIMWKNLAGNSKEDYFAASRQANDDHKKKYPDYYYSPKEARMRKRWKLQQQQVNQMMSTAQYNPVHLVKVYLNDEGGEGGGASPSSNDGGGGTTGKKSANATSVKTSH